MSDEVSNPDAENIDNEDDKKRSEDDEPTPIGASEDSILNFISIFLPLQRFISNKIRDYNILSNETNKSIKVGLNVNDLEINKSDVLSSQLRTVRPENSLQYESIIVDARKLGTISFSNFQLVNLKNYEYDKHIASQLLMNTSIKTATLQLQWTDYHIQLLDLLIASFFPASCKSIIIDFSSDDSTMQYFDTQILSKVLNAFGRHLPTVIACNKLLIRNIPKARINSIASEICPLLNLFPTLEMLSVTSKDDVSYLQKQDDVDYHAETMLWTKYLCIHPNLRYLQLHNVSNHFLPVYLLSGSTPYGFIGTLHQVKWYVIPAGTNGFIQDDEVSINNKTQNEKYSLSTFEMLLTAQLILNNTYTEEIQFSPIFTAESHSNLRQILEKEAKVHESRVVVTIEDVDEVLCCIVRRDETGE
jgi:hypothetical protein